jgi:hypothetical protein
MSQNLQNFYTKTFIFLQNVLFENNSPFEEHSNFIQNQVFRQTVKFSIDIIELIIESSYFPKSAIVIVIFIWLVH